MQQRLNTERFEWEEAAPDAACVDVGGERCLPIDLLLRGAVDALRGVEEGAWLLRQAAHAWRLRPAPAAARGDTRRVPTGHEHDCDQLPPRRRVDPGPGGRARPRVRHAVDDVQGKLGARVGVPEETRRARSALRRASGPRWGGKQPPWGRRRDPGRAERDRAGRGRDPARLATALTGPYHEQCRASGHIGKESPQWFAGSPSSDCWPRPPRAGRRADCELKLGFRALASRSPRSSAPAWRTSTSTPPTATAEQRTTAHHGQGGLLVWRKADNWTAFTDGYWTWVNGPNGVQRRLNTERFDWEAPAAAQENAAPGVDSPGGAATAPSARWARHYDPEKKLRPPGRVDGRDERADQRLRLARPRGSYHVLRAVQDGRRGEGGRLPGARRPADRRGLARASRG